MQIGRHADGRSLNYSDTSKTYDLDGAPVTIAEIVGYDQAKQVEWLSDDLSAWARGLSVETAAEEAGIDKDAQIALLRTQVAAARTGRKDAKNRLSGARKELDRSKEALDVALERLAGLEAGTGAKLAELHGSEVYEFWIRIPGYSGPVKGASARITERGSLSYSSNTTGKTKGGLGGAAVGGAVGALISAPVAAVGAVVGAVTRRRTKVVTTTEVHDDRTYELEINGPGFAWSHTWGHTELPRLQSFRDTVNARGSVQTDINSLVAQQAAAVAALRAKFDDASLAGDFAARAFEAASIDYSNVYTEYANLRISQGGLYGPLFSCLASTDGMRYLYGAYFAIAVLIMFLVRNDTIRTLLVLFSLLATAIALCALIIEVIRKRDRKIWLIAVFGGLAVFLIAIIQPFGAAAPSIQNPTKSSPTQIATAPESDPTEETSGTQAGEVPVAETPVAPDTPTVTESPKATTLTIFLTEGSLGDYGEMVTLDGDEYIWYHVPAGVYNVSSNTPGTYVYLDKNETVTNSDGLNEWINVDTLEFPRAGGPQTLTVGADQHIELTLGAQIVMTSAN